jgi:hypothetical protein
LQWNAMLRKAPIHHPIDQKYWKLPQIYTILVHCRSIWVICVWGLETREKARLRRAFSRVSRRIHIFTYMLRQFLYWSVINRTYKCKTGHIGGYCFQIHTQNYFKYFYHRPVNVYLRFKIVLLLKNFFFLIHHILSSIKSNKKWTQAIYNNIYIQYLCTVEAYM